MKIDNYNFEASASLLEFQFFSVGPKGKIKKGILFKPFENNKKVFNIGFGDVDENGNINDLIATGNQDSEKVLATVVLTIFKFFEKYPDCYVYATGSTHSRTRLYQMGINKNLKEISQLFDVYGFTNNSWETFSGLKKYDAFLVRQKK